MSSHASKDVQKILNELSELDLTEVRSRNEPFIYPSCGGSVISSLTFHNEVLRSCLSFSACTWTFTFSAVLSKLNRLIVGCPDSLALARSQCEHVRYRKGVHAKIYLVRTKYNTNLAYIGSYNLTQPTLTDLLVRVPTVEYAQVETFFNAIWENKHI